MHRTTPRSRKPIINPADDPQLRHAREQIALAGQYPGRSRDKAIEFDRGVPLKVARP
jgi:hypothetical protein